MQNISYYVHQVPKEFLEKLKLLKENGIKLFVCSNSFFKFGNLILNEVIGKNWKDYFDFLIYDAQKPDFFNSKIQKNFTDYNYKPIKDFNSYIEAKD